MNDISTVDQTGILDRIFGGKEDPFHVIRCQHEDCKSKILYIFETKYQIYCEKHLNLANQSDIPFNIMESEKFKKCSSTNCFLNRFTIDYNSLCFVHFLWKQHMVGDIESRDIKKRGYHLFSPALEIMVDACIPHDCEFVKTDGIHHINNELEYFNLHFLRLKINKEQFKIGLLLIDEEIRRRECFNEVLSISMDERHESWMKLLKVSKVIFTRILDGNFFGTTRMLSDIFAQSGVYSGRVSQFILMYGNGLFERFKHKMHFLPFHDLYNPRSFQDSKEKTKHSFIYEENYKNYLDFYLKDCSLPKTCPCDNCKLYLEWGCPDNDLKRKRHFTMESLSGDSDLIYNAHETEEGEDEEDYFHDQI